MNNTDSLFGPLGREYCIWFYFLSVVGFISMMFVLISGIALGFSKKAGATFYFNLFAGVILYGMIYLQNRLLHTMCINSA